MLDNYDYDVLSQTLYALNSIMDDVIYKKIKTFVSDKNINKIRYDLTLLKENNKAYNLVDIEGYIKLITQEANKGISKYDTINR